MKKNRSWMITEIKGRMSATSLTILQERKINTIRDLKRQRERKKTAYERFKTNQWFDVDEGSSLSQRKQTNTHSIRKAIFSHTSNEPHHDNNKRKTRRILETNVGECKRSTY